MKFLFSILLTISILSVTAQERTFAPEGAEWTYLYVSLGQLPTGGCNWTNCAAPKGRMYLEKDTMIGDIPAGILKATIGGEDGSANDQKGRLIVTNTGDKVYSYINGDFYLLYDFSARDGDTLDIYLPNNDGLFSIAYYPIDTSIVHLKVRVYRYDESTNIAYYVSDYNDEVGEYRMTVYDGIGQFINTHKMAIGAITAEVSCGNKPICYSDNTKTIGFNGDCGCEFLVVVPTSTESILEEVKVYPNPVQDDLLLEGVEGNTSYTITNSFGEISSNGLVNEKIHTGNLTSGIYFLSLHTSSGVKSMKFSKE